MHSVVEKPETAGPEAEYQEYDRTAPILAVLPLIVALLSGLLLRFLVTQEVLFLTEVAGSFAVFQSLF